MRLYFWGLGSGEPKRLFGNETYLVTRRTVIIDDKVMHVLISKQSSF